MSNEQVDWIIQFITNADAHPGLTVDADELALARQSLESSDNILAVLNLLEPMHFIPFINMFFRPYDNVKAYQSLVRRIETGSPDNKDIICHAIMTHNVEDCSIPDVANAYKEMRDQLSYHVQSSVRAWLKIMNAKTSREKKIPVIPSDCFINLSMIDLPDLSLRFEDLPYTNLDWSYLEEKDLRGIGLRLSSLAFSHLRNSILISANFFGSNLISATLDGAKLNKADMRLTNLTDASFEDAIMEGVNLESAKIENTNFTNANLNYAVLDCSTGKHPIFEGCQMTGASMKNATHHSANFKKAHLPCARFSRTKLDFANFEDANLEHVILNTVSLNKANLKKANLTNTILTNVDLSEADLSGAILVHADIRDTNILNAKLDRVEFFTQDHLKKSAVNLQDELTWWHQQIDLRKDRRELRKLILTDLLTKAKGLTSEEKKSIYEVAFHHPIFAHRKKSLRGSMNRMFAKLDTHRYPIVVVKSPSQELLARDLKPRRSRKHLHISKHSIRYE